jgi:sarcosine oxidase subunit beta
LQIVVDGHAEVLVVGAGIVGLAIARELGLAGVEVTVLEREGIGAGASGVQPGGVRRQWGTAVNCRLASESFAFWQVAEERLRPRVPFGFRPCGYLFTAHSQNVLHRLAAGVRLQREAGVPSRIVSAAEAAELVPGLDPSSLTGAAWCATDGYFDRPQSVVEAYADGVRVVPADVIRLEADGAGWIARLHDDHRRHADAVVVAAGVATSGLVAPLGIELPIEPEERFLFLSAPIRERLLEPLVVSAELRFAAKQLGNGRVLTSDLGAAGDPEAGLPTWQANVRAGIRTLVPSLEYVDLGIVVPGIYDTTPDRQAILGPLPGLDGLHVAAGFSGHGFMLAPAVARIVAGAVLGEPPDPVLTVLDAARFAEGRLVPEPAIV